MKYKKILPLNKTQSLIAIKDENGNIKFGISYKFEEQVGNKFPCDRTFDSLGGAIKYAATNCFKPMHRYILIETGHMHRTFSSYKKAEREFDEKVKNYINPDNIEPKYVGYVYQDVHKRKTCEIYSLEYDYAEPIILQILDIIC